MASGGTRRNDFGSRLVNAPFRSFLECRRVGPRERDLWPAPLNSPRQHLSDKMRDSTEGGFLVRHVRPQCQAGVDHKAGERFPDSRLLIGNADPVAENHFPTLPGGKCQDQHDHGGKDQAPGDHGGRAMFVSGIPVIKSDQ